MSAVIQMRKNPRGFYEMSSGLSGFGWNGLGDFDWQKVASDIADFGKTFLEQKYQARAAGYQSGLLNNPNINQNLALQTSLLTNGVAITPGQAFGQGINGTLASIGNFFGVSGGTVVIGSLVGAWLLFRDPPQRRR